MEIEDVRDLRNKSPMNEDVGNAQEVGSSTLYAKYRFLD